MSAVAESSTVPDAGALDDILAPPQPIAATHRHEAVQDQQVRQRRTRPPAAVSMRARRNEGDVEGEGWGSAAATKAKNRRGPRGPYKKKASGGGSSGAEPYTCADEKDTSLCLH